MEQLLSLTQEQADALAFGVISLDADGIVVGYNKAESAMSGLDPKRVLGRNFFEEIAPCTQVKEFAGLYRDMVKADATQSWEFNFVFRFAGGAKRVHIRLAYFPHLGRGLILVEDTGNVQPQSASGR